MTTLRALILLAISVSLVAQAALVAGHFMTKDDGIHIIGKDTVYLAGEACTVNMTFDRKFENIQSDMLDCLEIHKDYMGKLNP